MSLFLIRHNRTLTMSMSMSMNTQDTQAALAKKDETISHLLQLLCDIQTDHKAVLVKKDDTIERLIQLLSKELPRSSIDQYLSKSTATSSTTAAPTNYFGKSLTPATAATTTAPTNYFGKSLTPATSSSATNGFIFGQPATSYSFGQPTATSSTSTSTSAWPFGRPVSLPPAPAPTAAPTSAPAPTTSSGFTFGGQTSRGTSFAAATAVPAPAPAPAPAPTTSSGFTFGVPPAPTTSSGFTFGVPPASSYSFASPAIHHGISCDRSGMIPIVGVRYHLTGHNYDLCQAEYDKLSPTEKSQYEAIASP